MVSRKIFTEPLPKNLSPPSSGVSTVYETGNSMEVITVQSPQGNLSNYRRISGNAYVDTSTGKLKSYHPRNRSTEDYAQFNRSFTELRRTILTNFAGSRAELHVTLTISPELDADLASAHRFFRSYWKRLHYHYPTCEYVAIAEPHQTGRFHFHLLLLNVSGESLFIPNEEIQQLWRVGFTKAIRIDDVDRLASYFCSAEKRKRWATFYHPGQRLFRCSKGIARPSKMKMTREEVDAYVQREGYRRVSGYSCAIRQETGDGTERTLNVIVHERFRR